MAGSASYRIFMTDYSTYAAVFTCQKLAFANRQSVSILARQRTLDKQYLDKVSFLRLFRVRGLNSVIYCYIIFSAADPQPH